MSICIDLVCIPLSQICMSVLLAAMFMAPAQMAYPTAYPSFPGVTPPNSLMGSMMPPPVGMVAQPGASGMVAPMAMPAGYMGGMQASMMGVPNGQYSGLENSIYCIDHGVAKSWTRLSDLHFHFS